MNYDNHDFLRYNLVPIAVSAAALLLLAVGVVLGGLAYREYCDAGELERAVAAADSLLTATADQARERGLGALLLADPRNDWARRRLAGTRARAEEDWHRALRQLEGVVGDRTGEGNLQSLARQLQIQHDDLHASRERLDRFLAGAGPAPALEDWLAATGELNETAAQAHDELVVGLSAPRDIALASLLVKRTVWTASEHDGRNRAILAHHAAAGTPVPAERAAALRTNRTLARRAMKKLLQMRDSSRLDPRLARSLDAMAAAYETHCRPTCDRMLAAADTGAYPLDGRQWFETVTGYIDTMLAVSAAVSESNRATVEQLVKRRLLLLVSYIAVTALVGLLALASLRRVRRQTRDYFRQQELAEVTLGSIGDAVITTDADGCVEYINPIAQELTGWNAEEARGRPFREVFRLYNRIHASMTDPVGTCLAEGAVIGLTSGHVLICHDGKEVPIEDSAAPIRDREGTVVGAVVVFYDTRKSGQNHLLSYHATRDALTGLVNRREFEHRLEELLARTREGGGVHALAYIDLDQFKVVNDSCGHTAGDRMLRQVAFLLQKRVRASDTLARLGGDEFGLLFSNCTMEQALRVAEELRRTVQDFRFPWEEQVFQNGISIGLVPITTDSVSVAELLSEADAACYMAKEKGRNRIQVYHPDDLELAQRQGEMRWLPRIREALEEDRLVLYCQPIRALRSGLPDYVEITVRLRQADGEIIPPMAFIPAAERYNLMPDIDRWVIRNACRQLAGRVAQHASTVFTVNLSGTSLSENQTGDYIRRQAAEHRIPPERLCFEITETAAIINLADAIELIQSLREDGFAFALDDFGSGVSSLTYLKNLPVQLLKIDGAFVRNMIGEPLDLAMVQSFISIGEAVGIATCAEFVENEAILQRLKAMDIDYAQGYAVAMPLPLADYLHQHEEGRGTDVDN